MGLRKIRGDRVQSVVEATDRFTAFSRECTHNRTYGDGTNKIWIASNRGFEKHTGGSVRSRGCWEGPKHTQTHTHTRAPTCALLRAHGVFPTPSF